MDTVISSSSIFVAGLVEEELWLGNGHKGLDSGRSYRRPQIAKCLVTGLRQAVALQWPLTPGQDQAPSVMWISPWMGTKNKNTTAESSSYRNVYGMDKCELFYRSCLF